ncbi:MAG TPA: helix-hairpin-helix domain-containing protein [Anaeromyxobacteraceae bacterium]|nr:helix-hairpin-helix domain-containing protein [Anaeromyxobacteraceae bacterium]
MRRVLAVAAVLGAMLQASPAAAKTPLRSGERIDLNRATLTELMRLPSVGRKRAEAIMAQRGRRPFQRVDELAKVKGISAGWIARNRAVLAVGEPSPSAPRARGAALATR